MKLVRFSVTNYRSITKAHRIEMDNMTVLVGRNNEGKSNILQALSVAMDTLRIYTDYPHLRGVPSARSESLPIRLLGDKYLWDRDFPVSLQNGGSEKRSVIDLIFALTETELKIIRENTGIALNSKLPVRVSLNEMEAKVDIPKQGTAAFGVVQTKRRILGRTLGTDICVIPQPYNTRGRITVFP